MTTLTRCKLCGDPMDASDTEGHGLGDCVDICAGCNGAGCDTCAQSGHTLNATSTGSLCILNTGEGDIQVTFNNHDDVETEKAIAMLVDMQKRGYAILVRLEDGTYVRAVAIDATRQQYVIQTTDAVHTSVDDAAAAPVPEKRRGNKARVPIKTSRAVGVGRSAGG